jgi:hypothetical protein
VQVDGGVLQSGFTIYTKDKPIILIDLGHGRTYYNGNLETVDKFD